MAHHSRVLVFAEDPAQVVAGAQHGRRAAQAHVPETVHLTAAVAQFIRQPSFGRDGKFEVETAGEARRFGQRREHALDPAVKTAAGHMEDPHDHSIRDE